jgi:hypothetical protein
LGLETLKGKDQSEELGVGGKIILERFLENRVGRCGLDSSGSGQGPVASSCEHGNERTFGFRRRRGIS